MEGRDATQPGDVNVFVRPTQKITDVHKSRETLLSFCMLSSLLDQVRVIQEFKILINLIKVICRFLQYMFFASIVFFNRRLEYVQVFHKSSLNLCLNMLI